MIEIETPLVWAYVFLLGDGSFAGACLAHRRVKAATDMMHEMLKRGARPTAFYTQASYMEWFNRNAAEKAIAA